MDPLNSFSHVFYHSKFKSKSSSVKNWKQNKFYAVLNVQKTFCFLIQLNEERQLQMCTRKSSWVKFLLPFSRYSMLRPDNILINLNFHIFFLVFLLLHFCVLESESFVHQMQQFNSRGYGRDEGKEELNYQAPKMAEIAHLFMKLLLWRQKILFLFAVESRFSWDRELFWCFSRDD